MNERLDLHVESLESRTLLASVGGHVDIPNIESSDAHSLHVANQHGHLVVWGSDSTDRIVIRGKAGDPESATVRINGVSFGSHAIDNGIVVFGKEGNDAITLARIHESSVIDGGAGNDILRGGFGDDSLIGGDGKDRLFGSRGDDSLWGDAAKDSLFGQADNDVLYEGTGMDVLVGGPGDNTVVRSTFDVNVIKDITYVTRGSVELKADVYVPDAEGPFPGVVAIHGGYFRFGSKSQMARRAKTIAAHGFTVVAINYRLSPAHQFPAHIEDAQAAVRWMRTEAATYKIDPDRIGSYGYSAGGNLALLLGTIETSLGVDLGDDDSIPSSRVQAVVAGGAPVDFTRFDEDSGNFEYLLGGTRGEVPELYEQISPTHSLTDDDPPIFLFHGSRDTTVIRPTALTDLMDSSGHDYAFYDVSRKAHVAAAFDFDALTTSIEFLIDRLS